MSDDLRVPAVTVERDAAAVPVPSLPVRLLQTFVSPGKMASTVARHPRWLGAMLVGAVLVGLSVALIPQEIFEEMRRRAVIRSGGPVQEFPERARAILRVANIAGAVVMFVILSFIGAGVRTFVFAFVLGDEGKYRQYLAVGTHAAVIWVAAALVLVPVRIAARDPQLTISLATFLFFLPDGYMLNVLRALDLSRIWSTLVTALGIHAIDRRRSFGSAAAIQLGILLVLALAQGWLLTRFGL